MEFYSLSEFHNVQINNSRWEPIDRLYFVDQVAVYGMYVPTMAFFAKVSDPVIGGTYMTLLNTITNLGMWIF